MFKKTTALLLALFMIILTMPAVLSSIAYATGDINADGSVNVSDYILVKRYVLGKGNLTSAQLALSDLDNDGDVDDVDYIMIRRIALGITESRVDNQRIQPISYSKSYTLSQTPSDTYPDTLDMELTDGTMSSSAVYSSEAYVGFESSPVDIIINLGSEGTSICGFALSFLVETGVGVRAPYNISVYGSSDRTNWSSCLGSVTSYGFNTPDGQYTASINLASSVNYRYIKFTVYKSGYWLFIDEAIVYGNVEVELSASNDYYISDTLTDGQRQSNINNVASGSLFEPDYGRILVSEGTSYSIDCSGYDPRCGSDSSILTDGVSTSASFEKDNAWVGVNPTRESSLTVTLGSSTQSDICGFALHCFNRPSANIVLPEYVDISVSARSSSGYTTIGRVYATDSSQENYAYVLNLDTLVNARYVKFTFPSGDGYYWFEEAQVFANRASDEPLYGTFDMPLSEVTSYWSKSDSDYYFEQNLLLNRQPEIWSHSEIVKSENNVANNTLETSTALTDGVYSDNTNRKSDEWFGFYSGSGRSVFFDLGNISSVSGVSIDFLCNTSDDVYLTQAVDIVISENGRDWYTAGQIRPHTNNYNSSLNTSVIFDKSYRARYVMFSFVIDYMYVCIDEITVTGTKNIKNAVELSKSGLESYGIDFGYSYAAPSDDLLGGAEDVCLIYFTNGEANADMLLPYAAYLDESANIVDTMFDAFLFLPEGSQIPSEGRAYKENTASDWYWLADEVFAENKNLDALDKVAGKIKYLLGKEDYKYKVFLTIPYMYPTLSGAAGDRDGDGIIDGFGDIDKDGYNEDFSNISTRVKVATYYAKYLTQRFNASNYDNIELCGFYYFHEEIRNDARHDTDNDASTDDEWVYGLQDEEAVPAINAAFDELGYQLFWIPYFSSWSNNTRWQEFGFDNACLQPNYVFDVDETDESRIEDAAKLAQQYNMSIEIEISPSSATDRRYAQKYFDYLSGGIKYGYINDCIHMFYQSFDRIGINAYSDNPLTRMIYTYTYQFIKGDLDISPDKVENLTFSASMNSVYSDTVNLTDSDTNLYRIGTSPKHGSISVSENGEFSYYPNKGYKGTDTFTYQIGNYLGWSQECTVTVTVG